jgi:hypothetical protein
MYIERKRKWQHLFAYGQKIASQTNISQKDIIAEIKSQRKRNSVYVISV